MLKNNHNMLGEYYGCFATFYLQYKTDIINCFRVWDN